MGRDVERKKEESTFQILVVRLINSRLTRCIKLTRPMVMASRIARFNMLALIKMKKKKKRRRKVAVQQRTQCTPVNRDYYLCRIFIVLLLLSLLHTLALFQFLSNFTMFPCSNAHFSLQVSFALFMSPPIMTHIYTMIHLQTVRTNNGL